MWCFFRSNLRSGSTARKSRILAFEISKIEQLTAARMSEQSVARSAKSPYQEAIYTPKKFEPSLPLRPRHNAPSDAQSCSMPRVCPRRTPNNPLASCSSQAFSQISHKFPRQKANRQAAAKAAPSRRTHEQPTSLASSTPSTSAKRHLPSYVTAKAISAPSASYKLLARIPRKSPAKAVFRKSATKSPQQRARHRVLCVLFPSSAQISIFDPLFSEFESKKSVRSFGRDGI